MTLPLKRGDVVYVHLDEALGAEKKGYRPCVVVQNNIGNQYSPLTIVLPITDARQDKALPVQVRVSAHDLWAGAKDSVIEGGHVRTVDRSARIDKERGVLCTLTDEIMLQVDRAMRTSLGLA